MRTLILTEIALLMPGDLFSNSFWLRLWISGKPIHSVMDFRKAHSLSFLQEVVYFYTENRL
jgi:hypothetical protein